MAKGDRKPRGIISSGNAGNGAKSKTTSKADAGNGQLPLQKAAPSAKAVVAASSSWTGKLPATLLHEHCNKLGWEKVTYDMRHTPGGFTATAVLGQRNPKSSQIETIRFTPPDSLVGPQPTALEARHFAATYALHRIASHKNLQMVLPGEHKSLWRKMEDTRRLDVRAGKAHNYSADPFVAQRERNEAAALAKRHERADETTATETGTTPLKPPAVVKKGWERVPVIDMSREVRTLVEACIRKYHVWANLSARNGTNLEQDVIRELVQLGFRKSHVIEAGEYTSSRQTALEWLLIHVPEDDLPPTFLPENYTPGVTLITGSLQLEYAVKRIAQGGYPVELVRETIEECSNSECKAIEKLMFSLQHPDTAFEFMEDDTSDESWNEEIETLSAIYGDRFSNPLPHFFEVKLSLPDSDVYNKDNLSLRFHKTSGYPSAKLPSLSLFATQNSRPRNLPSYIRLSVVLEAANYASEHFLGEPMCFSIVEWIQENLADIVNHPVKLKSLSGAVYGISFSGDANTIDSLFSSLNLNTNPSAKRYTRRFENTKSISSQELLNTLNAKLGDPKMEAIYKTRRSLPAWDKRESIVSTVRENQVTLITGETGSGKSTQSVQFILDELILSGIGNAANIICTQPRRISAMGLAARVAEERGCQVGEQVGYVIRGESKVTAATTLRFMTTGVVLRMLQMDPDSALKQVSHIFIDEVHERSLDGDFLLIILKRLVATNKKIKVILMSATVDAKMFSDYFGGAGHVNIEGRTFPVDDLYVDDILRVTGFRPLINERNNKNDKKVRNTDDRGGESKFDDEPAEKSTDHLEDSVIGKSIAALGDRINYDFITCIVEHIDRQLAEKDGAILIFLPGTAEISRCISSISGSGSRFHCLPLHASLIPSDQRKVFFAPPKGKRKVVAATNVAETSITIPDVIAVIDTGRVKETVFDPQTIMTRLVETWVSQASAKQRRGRAGRVSRGACYKLYTRHAERTRMPIRQVPEIGRTSLEQLYLMVKAMKVGDAGKFLREALDPPDIMAIEAAKKVLVQVGALDEGTSELTALGTHLSTIPADLKCAKLLVYGSIFGCLELASVIAAILTVRSPFILPPGDRDVLKTVRATFSVGQGDVIADARAFLDWEAKVKTSSYRSARQWCEENYLSAKTLEDIGSTRDQYLSALQEIGFISSTRLASQTYTSAEYSLIRALLAASMNPSIARIQFPEKKYLAMSSGAVELDPEAKTIKLFTRDDGRVFIHPSSTLFSAQSFVGGGEFMSFFHKMATSKIFIRELTPFGGYSLLIFGGMLGTDLLGRGVTVGNWIRLRCWARIGVLVGRMRILLDQLLALKLEIPEIDVSGHEIVHLVKRLIDQEGL
ncbi:P-loop containing nucleoside triphosphate hydrolase protein [Lipomyces tetrasporus]|uniref:RNA helicase n=1 Tax=Lipomyces tetrasporus TaxID=54092 RepID=A0AAD7QQY1_9ASCO|nr:P-loop containing nucleoside triphosphate hydrolase protein [Lipomyces tetrasporus]KAJ8099663.1 P-loop containing nucleoside triphosphate hydrolase protein [Lipomyces tetrasporus]